jgi:hypothetical protein
LLGVAPEACIVFYLAQSNRYRYRLALTISAPLALFIAAGPIGAAIATDNMIAEVHVRTFLMGAICRVL